MNKYIYKEIRKMDSDDLRSLCIRENWYTKGNCEEYSNLLEMPNKDIITTDDIVEIATDIVDHSDMDFALAPYDSILRNVMFKLAKICYTYFEQN